MKFNRLFTALFCSALVLAGCSGKRDDSSSSSESSTSEDSSFQMEKENDEVSSSQSDEEPTAQAESAANPPIAESVDPNAQAVAAAQAPTPDDAYLMIVNKKHPISAEQEVGENPVAHEALMTLIAAMQNQGLNISNSYSGFRTYEYQSNLYNNYCASYGQAEADTFSARPGYSEHESGLAFDLIDNYGQLVTSQPEAQWLLDHAHEYGFIVRYQEGKESITGYMPEPWHIRYVGSVAPDIASSGLTLEEYLGVEGGDYN
ncbi:MAG: D-alanyl-D-alanine carboxypeptidase family protein [Allobaculum sp.]